MDKKPKIRFQINWDKTIEAVDFISRNQKGITQYYVGKICYFADKEHMLDYGRPITGDRYVAMEYGPVPSSIRDLLNKNYALPDEILEKFHARIRIIQRDNRQHISSTEKHEFQFLSGSDKEYLLDALKKYGHMAFGKLKDLSHDEAWREAWDISEASEMNPTTWLDLLGQEGRDSALAYLSEQRVKVA